MTEEQFKWLCNICDQTLLEKEATDSTVAVSWLHVIRPHPEILIKYKKIFNRRYSVNYKLESIITRSFILLSQLFHIFIVALKILQIYEKKITDSRIDFLIVSHRLNNLKKYNDDLYFGNLPLSLANEGYKVLIAYIDHTSGYKKNTENKYLIEKIEHLILPKVLSIKTEYSILKTLYLERIRILNLAKKITTNSLLDNFFKNLLDQIITKETRGAYRIGIQIGELVKKLDPKFLITTYEGHAWERLVFSNARKSNQKIICMGYQHAPIFYLQHANCRNLKSNYNPDIILTSGKISYQKLKKTNVDKYSMIRLLGTHRARKNNNITGFKDYKEVVISVCPEGINSEFNIIKEFLIKSAQVNPEIKFLLRLHPSIKRKAININRLPKNVEVSSSDISTDFLRSTHILYRGSSIVMEAVTYGIQPIYFGIRDEIDINPLFDINDYILKVFEPTDLIAGIFSKAYRDDHCFQKIIKYCKESYTPFSYKNLVDVLSKRDC